MPYTVKRGDSLSKIAAKLGIQDWRDIYNLNKDVIGGDPDLIRPGQTFVLPNEAAVDEEEAASEVDSEETDVGGGQTVKEGAPEEEDQAKEGVGVVDDDDSTPDLTILTGEEMKWYFDKNSGTWFVEYGLPGSKRSMIFEAQPDQMDALFGTGQRPTSFQRKTLKTLTSRSSTTFGGSIAEMEGTGRFEDEVQRVQTLALDEGKLPEWAKGDTAIMDILYVAESEGKGSDWMLEQISKTNTFKSRFPSINKFKDDGNLSLQEAVTGFLEMESGIRQARKSAGLGDAVDPATVGNLLSQGYSLRAITDTVQEWKRAKEFQPAMEAFNQILGQQGFKPITDMQEMLDFVGGRAPADMYQLWEASSITESAAAAGLGDIFTAEDAIQAARATDQTLESSTAAMQKSAEMLLRLRHEVDIGKFDLTAEELIDINLGQTPRSGRSQAEISESVNRAVLSAQGTLKKKAQPFRDFSVWDSPDSKPR